MKVLKEICFDDVQLLRINDVAKMLGVSKSTIWLWLRLKRFPAPLKINNSVIVWKLSAIKSFIDSQEVSR